MLQKLEALAQKVVDVKNQKFESGFGTHMRNLEGLVNQIKQELGKLGY